MGLEAASFLNDLVAANPVGGDTMGQGDDHIRLLKTVAKASFPNVTKATYLDQPRADVASGATTNIGGATTNFVRITGVTTITAFDNVAAGIWRHIQFGGVLTLTHGAGLLLPGTANIVTAADDRAVAMSLGSGNWIVLAYVKANGQATVLALPLMTTLTLETALTTLDGIWVHDDSAGASRRSTLGDLVTSLGLLRSSVESQGPLTGGASVTSKDLGTQSGSGTLTMDVSDRALQHCVNGGPFTLAPGATNGSCFLDVTNNASAGAVTTSGFTKVSGSFDTTNGSKFRCTIVVGNAGSTLDILKMV